MRRGYLVSGLVLLGCGLASALAPVTMLNPGDLVQGHQTLASDCLACHTLGRGVTRGKCSACHALETIDRDREDRALHRELSDSACVACHTDHRGRDARSTRQDFAHASLRAELAARCDACHRPPADGWHSQLAAACGQCHQPQSWREATFSHDALPSAVTADCAACHDAPAPPAASAHAMFVGPCARCHETGAWAHIVFDHDAYFRFDDDHSARCASCHTRGRLDGYSCYGCHAHSPAEVAREHLEEGLDDFERCVTCHRSGDEHEAARPRGATGRPLQPSARRPRHEDEDEDEDDDERDDEDDEDDEDDD